MSLVEVNGTQIFYRVRGQGPPVLFISGAGGDADHWTRTARHLAADFTVITYDRRGNSRSPRPPGWTATSVDERADDTAGLIRSHDLGPVIAFGTSAGASVLSNMVLRRSGVLRAAVFHEPPFVSVVADAEAVRAGRQALIHEGLHRGGPRAAMEQLLRGVAGDAVVDAMDPVMRERLLVNGEVFFGLELDEILDYLPAPELLVRDRLPCTVVAGADNRELAAVGHWRYAASRWLAAQLGIELTEMPGAHAPYLTEPEVGELEHRSGNWTAACADATEAMRCAEEGRDAASLTAALVTLARIDAARGDVARFHHRLDRARRHATEHGIECAGVELSSLLGLAALGAGNHEVAAAHLEAARSAAGSGRLLGPTVLAFCGDLVEALIRAGPRCTRSRRAGLAGRPGRPHRPRSSGRCGGSVPRSAAAGAGRPDGTACDRAGRGAPPGHRHTAPAARSCGVILVSWCRRRPAPTARPSRSAGPAAWRPDRRPVRRGSR